MGQWYCIDKLGHICKCRNYTQARSSAYVARLCIDDCNIIWGVRTKMQYRRKGYMTKIFKFIHTWNKEYRLFAKKGSIAASFYKKLGYQECSSNFDLNPIFTEMIKYKNNPK